MSKLNRHLRNTFLAGIFAATPLAVTAFAIWYIETTTRRLFHLPIPFVGVLLALAGIYLLGLIVTSLIGQWLLRHLDRLLLRVPGLKDLYQAWKQISLTPGGREGMFARVVLIPVETGTMRQLGFSNGDPLPDDPTMTAVFVPAAPNPMNGRLYIVRLCDCQFLSISAEEAFKMILSTGNYVPPEVGQATKASSPV
jgi:uncharacterized membrane protein